MPLDDSYDPRSYRPRHRDFLSGLLVYVLLLIGAAVSL
jgi:hypothetical protein